MLVGALLSLLVVAKMTNLTLDAAHDSVNPARRLNHRRHSPALTWPSLIASHMAPAAIQARMVDLPSSSLLLLSSILITVL